MEHTKQKRQGLIIAIATVSLALLVAGAILLYKGSRAPVQEGRKQFSLHIAYPGEEPRELELASDEEYLGAALLAKGLISGSESEYGLMVDTVDGLFADPAKGEYWVFTKSGEWVTTGVEQTPLADGDQYEFFLYEG